MSDLTPNLRIAIVTGSVSRLAGGLFQSVRMLALALHKLNVNVAVFGLIDEYTDTDFDSWLPLKPKVFSPVGPASIGYSFSLRKELRAFAPDIVHQHGIWQAFSLDVLRWRRETGCPSMISPRGMLDVWALQHASWKKQLALSLYERRNLNDAACLHALNESEHETMRVFGIRQPIAVIPNGVHLPISSKSSTEIVGKKDKDNRKVLLFLGRIHPKKGVEELLHGWSLATEKNTVLAKKWRLVIAGWDDGGHESKLHNHAVKLGIIHDVEFIGSVTGEFKERTFRDASCFILPSYSEGLPLAILEAWSYSLPVIMTPACNLPEGFEVGAAWSTQPTPEAIADSLVTLSQVSQEVLTCMGDAGTDLVRSRFDWSLIAVRHLEIYERLYLRSSLEDI